MINLIPNQEKKEMTKGFRYRLAVLFLAMAGVSLVFAFMAVLPSYFLSSAKKRIVYSKLDIQKNEPVPLLEEQTVATIKDLNHKLDIVEKAEKNKFSISLKVINSIVLKKMPSIKITTFTYENVAVTGKKISIQGTAPSREVLLSFRQALEDSTSFKQVDLPISNFVKGSNIEFYLSLIPA
jgi:Tfp pilus assembly protein PilN